MLQVVLYYDEIKIKKEILNRINYTSFDPKITSLLLPLLRLESEDEEKVKVFVNGQV